MLELYLCSFASPDLKRSASRFEKQSKKMNVYKKIKIYGLNDLSDKKKTQIKSFKKKRLFGFASWKPEIILDFIEKIPNNSILQYSDVGCHFNENGKERLKDYVNITNKNEILAFQYKMPNFEFKKKLKFQIYFENQYTKSDLFKFFNLDCMYLGIKTPCIQNLEFISANFLNIMPYLGFSILFAAYATATILKN